MRAGEKAAKNDNRALGALMEKLLIDHLKATGYLPDARKPPRKTEVRKAVDQGFTARELIVGGPCVVWIDGTNASLELCAPANQAHAEAAAAFLRANVRKLARPASIEITMVDTNDVTFKEIALAAIGALRRDAGDVSACLASAAK